MGHEPSQFAVNIKHADKVHAGAMVIDAHADIEVPGKESPYVGPDGRSKVAPDKMAQGGVDGVVLCVATGPGPRTTEGYTKARRENCLGSFTPYLIRESSYAQIINANTSYPPDLTPDLAPAEQAAIPYQKLPLAASRDHRELLAKSEFLGLVTQAYTDQDDVLFMLDYTERRLRDVQTAIRAERGDAAPAAAEQKP